MSREMVELAREVMEALGRRDLSTLLARADPEVEWHSFFAQLGEGGVYRGPDGTREYMRDLGDAWEIVRADIDDAIAVGDVAVLVGRIHYRGKGSGIETETPAGWMLKFREGKVVRFRAFREPGQALEAVGTRKVDARVMSQHNVEIMRRLFEATARGDTETVLDIYDDDVEWDISHGSLARLMGQEVYRGHEGIRRFFRDWEDSWGEIEYDLEELIEAGEKVAAVLTIRGRGRASGAEVEFTRIAGVWTLRNSKVVRVRLFETRAEALAAAGLSE